MTRSTPRLRVVAAPADPVGVVLLLHGGRERSHGAVRANQLAVLRMVPIAGRIARAGHGRLAIVRLQNRVRGWNAPELPAVADAHWALTEVRNRFGDVPIALVGHSMGGRTALRVAGSAGVTTVVGLAPWLPGGEPTDQLAGRSVLIIHGAADHTTDPRAAEAFARSIRTVAARVSFVLVPGVRHGLLRRRRLLEGLTAAFVETTLGGERDDSADPGEQRTGSADVTNLLHQVLAGTDRLVV